MGRRLQGKALMSRGFGLPLVLQEMRCPKTKWWWSSSGGGRGRRGAEKKLKVNRRADLQCCCACNIGSQRGDQDTEWRRFIVGGAGNAEQLTTMASSIQHPGIGQF